jgi:hypothetical protein
MVDIVRPSNTLGLREEVLRLGEELKIRQWQEQQLAIADGCDVCSSACVHVCTGDRTLSGRPPEAL